ncbi:hypothetical protein AB1Y20_022607 [Prymnesium parvum]|uniref:UDP-galactose transporter n=1 Tax=Prymnesium parvum TaxID=97485 RepID=A0AB34JIF7_PRYPA
MPNGGAHLDWRAWAALATFVVQNTGAVLLMRSSKNSGAFNSSVAVLIQEACIKLPVSIALFALECNGLTAAVLALIHDARSKPVEWLQLSVPALLYTICNVMVFVGYANLEAALGMVTYQSKILFTAFFSVILLKKKLSVNQWVAITILALGVICAQGVFDAKTPASASPSATVESATAAAIATGSLATTPQRHHHAHSSQPQPHASLKASQPHASPGHKGHGGKAPRRLFSTSSTHSGENHTSGRGSARNTAHHADAPRRLGEALLSEPLSAMRASLLVEGFMPADQDWESIVAQGRSLAEKPIQNRLIGFGAFIIASLCTSFASVWFEKMIKGESKPSLWLRNIQLAFYSSIIAALSLLKDYDTIAADGVFSGFTATAWTACIANGAGGLLVAVIIKYADNILRCFAQALAIILGSISSYFLFDFAFTPSFLLGVAFVVSAVFLYAEKTQTPLELAEKLLVSVGVMRKPVSMFAPIPTS